MAGEREVFLDYLEREGLTLQQREAVLSSRNVIVEAGAGTGKTKTLVARYLYHVLVEGVPPSRIVALTFTEKAAQEMKERIGGELAKFLGTPLEDRAYRAMERAVHAPIKTFHGFAAHILREYPVETGVDPSFTVLDEMGEDLFLEEAMNAYIGAHLENPSVTFLLSHWNVFQLKRALRTFFKSVLSEISWEEVENAVARVFPHSPEDQGGGGLARDADLPGELDIIRESLSLKGEVDELLAQGRCMGTLSRARASLETLEYLFTLLDSGEEPFPIVMRMARELDRFPSWGKCNYLRELAGLREMALSLWGWLEEVLGGDFYRAFLEVARGVEGVLEVMKTREGVLTFSDLQKGLLRGIRERRTLVEELRERFSRVLVDEYQDTNEIQREVVCRLCERRGDWAPTYQEVVLEEGKLFIVGDPKQSIYAFRGGDVAVYTRTKRQLGEGASLYLTESFRSGSSLVNRANRLFSTIFQPTVPLEEDYVVPFTPLVSSREGGELWMWELEEDEDYLEAMARLVIALKEKRGTWGGLALLVRRNATAVDLYRYLSGLEIPVVSSTAGELGEKREIQDVLLYLKALDNPADDYSVAGVLLAPFVGVTPDTLVALAERKGGIYQAWRAVVEEGPGSGAGKREAGATSSPIRELSREDWEAMTQGLKNFQALMEKKDRLTISGLIQEVVRTTGYGGWLAMKPWGDQALANLDRLARVARRFQKGRLFTLSEFLIYLDHWGLSSREVQEGFQEEEAVAILTVHAAKGLEFPVVVLAETWSQFRRNLDPVVYDPRGGLALRIPGLDFSPHYRRVATLKDQKGWEEEKRLLYVAFTRAQEELHLIFRRKKGRGGGYTWHDLLKGAGVKELAQVGNWEELPPALTQEGGREKGGRGVLELPLSWGRGGGLEVGVRHLLGQDQGEEGDLGAILHRALGEITQPGEASRWYQLHAQLFQGSGVGKQAFVRMVKTFFASPLYREIISGARRLYRELPLEAYYKGLKVKGRPDLLAVMEDGSLVLVEYKLKISTLYRGGYGDQLALYAWLVEVYTGTWPSRAYIYSISTGETQEVGGISRERALALLEEGYINLIGESREEVERD